MLELKWLWKYMGPKRRYLVIGLCLSAVTSAMLIINPMLSQKLIDEVITPQNTAKLLPLLGLMLIVQLTRLSLRYLMIVLLEKNSQQMLDDVRTRMYDVIQNEDYRFFGRMRTGDLMTRMTNDLDLIRHSTAWISYNVVDSVVIFAVTIAYFCTVNLQLTLCLAAITPFILLITMAFSKIVHPMYAHLREKLSRLNTVAQENIEGNRVVKAFAREKYEKQKFEERNEEYRKANLKTTYVGVKFQPLLDLLSQSLTVITLLVGGLFMIKGTLTAGEMLAFSSLTWALANPLRNLGMLINDIQRFFASCDMVMEVFYSVPSIVNRSGSAAPKKRADGDIEFRHVTFTVDGSDAVQDISFHAAPGKTIGIMGTTGSGKTSLINLMMRSYEPTQGEVLLDGKNVQDYQLPYLRRSMAVAMQDVFLFSDTVEGNIAYGQADMAQDEVIRCARRADADGFIRRLSDGYDTLIGERGVGLSGGQKQRISLARALAMRPSVLILDDTTSAVDMETEKYIQEQLRSLDFSCTKFVIAQRISSVQDADQILIMDKGRIIERGTHEELLKNHGFYYKIWALQNSVKEGEAIGA
ncbi:MAG: ABC transporter ATP-binding protein/permease [Oscillospiraceae bacterium]|nr:ABC transporter ATP-binding protein/permease [Oscillospiraceae bacterium]